jgi:hypothetical protein
MIKLALCPNNRGRYNGLLCSACSRTRPLKLESHAMTHELLPLSPKLPQHCKTTTCLSGDAPAAPSGIDRRFRAAPELGEAVVHAPFGGG